MYGMNGYMANGYPMMADPNAYGHHAMTGQMGGLASQYGYNLPPSAAAQMSGQMTTPSYMNGSSSYSYSMAPYMQVSCNLCLLFHKGKKFQMFMTEKLLRPWSVFPSYKSPAKYLKQKTHFTRIKVVPFFKKAVNFVNAFL